MRNNVLLYCLILFCTASVYAQTLKPTDKLALLTGVVTDFKNNPLAKEIIMFSNDKTKAVVKTTTDAKGQFAMLIPVGATYSLKYKNFTSDVDYTKMSVPTDKNATYEVGIQIDPPKDFVLENVYFDTGKSTLKPTSNAALNNLVEILKTKNTMVVEIQGHTDDVGKLEENMTLSQARADAVKNYLVSKGIENIRINSKGYGPTKPIAQNNSEAGKAKNRRTSLKVIKQ